MKTFRNIYVCLPSNSVEVKQNISQYTAADSVKGIWRIKSSLTNTQKGRRTESIC